MCNIMVGLQRPPVSYNAYCSASKRLSDFDFTILLDLSVNFLSVSSRRDLLIRSRRGARALHRTGSRSYQEDPETTANGAPSRVFGCTSTLFVLTCFKSLLMFMFVKFTKLRAECHNNDDIFSSYFLIHVFYISIAKCNVKMICNFFYFGFCEFVKIYLL